jgi:hypothetical protein
MIFKSTATTISPIWRSNSPAQLNTDGRFAETCGLPELKTVCHIKVMDNPVAQPKGPPIEADPRLDGAALAALRQRGLSDAAIRRALASLRPSHASRPGADPG